MGCFLGCFGGSKDAKRRRRRNQVSPRNHSDRVQNPPQSTAFTEQITTETEKSPVDLVPETRSEAEEPLSASPRKRVTFNSNVTTYEPIPVHESTESLPERNIVIEKEKKENVVKSTEDNSSCGDDSVTSSVGSYPPNHRYQNCRESDDEVEEFGDGSDSDNDDEDEDEDFSDCDEDDDGIIVGQEQDVWSESVITASMELRTKNSLSRMNSEEVNSPFKAPGLGELELKATGPKRHGRDRSVYIHPVLNPVENLTQWKAVKSKGTQAVKPQKENFAADLEAPRISFSTEPSFKSMSDLSKKPNQEIAVDASLSNWLVSAEATPTKKTNYSGLETITSERSVSHGSNSVISLDDRPILGALTVEELKQHSATSSPRKSPSRSPDDMPIIGTVGTYWNHTIPAKESGSSSSFKGIPNSTSKYREDKRVNWHSTPFETRLERALNRGATEA